MKKGVFRKEFAFAIILLFVGASAVSALNSKLLHNGSIEKTNEILVRGHIAYLCVSYDPSGEYPTGIYQFDLDDPGNLTLMYGGWFTGGDFDDIGNLYFCDYIGGLYMLDFETGQVTYIGPTIPLNGLTHDTTTDIWYGCSSYSIYIIDINTGASTLVGYTGMLNTPIGLACDNDGNIYTYDVLWSGNSHLYSIDKDTGYASVIGDMGYGFVYGQDPAYDRDDSILYIAGYFNDGSPSALLTCDTQTGACIIEGNFPGGVEVDGFAIPYESYKSTSSPGFYLVTF